MKCTYILSHYWHFQHTGIPLLHMAGRILDDYCCFDIIVLLNCSYIKLLFMFINYSKAAKTREIIMAHIKQSELPVFIDESTYALSFEEGLTCSGSGKKFAGQMKNLLATRLPFDEQEQVYEAYRDIIFEKDRSLFNKYDFRYDITVILPGEINGECKKTSGHYHGSISKQAFTYPEVYQVLEGVTAFVLQKVKDFEKPE